MDFKITKNAAKRIVELIAKNTKKMIALRISVDGGGCSGFMYQYTLVDVINNDDYIVENNDIKVVIDPLSQQFLDGCNIEFTEELGSNYFQINNPNATAKCGCGNSFAV
jgi:iron-sulfur cluster insertion protein